MIVTTAQSPSCFDRLTMDQARAGFVAALEAADRFDRRRIFYPVTRSGRKVIVHAKLMIVDDDRLLIGSSNLNNRSMGYDSECDVVLRAARDDRANRAAILRMRGRLIGHWLGLQEAAVSAIEVRCGGLIPALDALTSSGGGRLKPLLARPSAWGRLAAKLRLGDPTSPTDAWRPWMRLGRETQRPANNKIEH